MTHDELLARLGRRPALSVPDPAPLLERAFPARTNSRAKGVPAAALGGALLAISASASCWIGPAGIDRERTGTLIAAAVESARRCVHEWNRIGGRDE